MWHSGLRASIVSVAAQVRSLAQPVGYGSDVATAVAQI